MNTSQSHNRMVCNRVANEPIDTSFYIQPTCGEVGRGWGDRQSHVTVTLQGAELTLAET